MTMFVQLLLFACACALGTAVDVPPYGKILDSLIKSYHIIEDNILSMDGHIPLLNDSRRHYAEIIYVVHDEAVSETSCLRHDYFKDYQKNIAKSAPFAIAKPQKVVDGIKKLIIDILTGAEKVLELIKATKKDLAGNNKDLDKVVDESINKNFENLKNSTQIFLALGNVATQLNNNHDSYYALQAKNLNAHNFVINGSRKLQEHVMTLKNFYKVLYGHFGC